MESFHLHMSCTRIGAMNPAPSPLNGERAGVRGEKAKSFEFPKVRFMAESPDLRISDVNWGHEPNPNLT